VRAEHADKNAGLLKRFMDKHSTKLRPLAEKDKGSKSAGPDAWQHAPGPLFCPSYLL